MDFKLSLHASYWIGILTSLLIASLSFSFSENANVVAYIGFASTLASLILAVVAIIYSMVSNTDLYRSIGKIENSANNIVNTSLGLTELIKNLGSKIETLPEGFSSIHKRLDDITKEAKLEQPEKPSKALKENQWTEEHVRNFLDFNSFNGCLFTYACYLSAKKSKPFSIENIGIRAQNQEYSHGFFVALSSAALVSGEKSNENIYNIKKCNDYLAYGREALIKIIANRKITNGSIALEACESFFQ